MANCSEPGCDARHYARGFCETHYQRLRAENPRRCTVEGCDRPLKAKDRCQRHYDTWRNSPEAVAERGRCSRRGCDSPRKTRGLCDRHYQQARYRERAPKVGAMFRD